MPEGVEDRNADVWEALLAVADLAGGEWPENARVASVSLVASSADQGSSLGVTLLRDLRMSPWADLRGKPLDARGLARRLSKYGVRPTVYRNGLTTSRGYLFDELRDPFERYLVTLLAPDECETSATTQQVEAAPPW